MKRKPIQIMAGLINALNPLSKNQNYSINQIHEETNYHWNTVNDYIKLINLVKKFAPDLKIDDKTNEIKIKKQSPYFKNLKKLEQLILYLFISKAFNEESSINKNEIKLNYDSNLDLNEEAKEFIKQSNEGEIYLTLKGKFKAQGIFSSLYKKMIDFIENKSNLKENSNRIWLLNFYEDKESPYLKKKKRFLKTTSRQNSEEDEEKISEYKKMLDLSEKALNNISTENIA
ncbi:MAG: hypothetical protein GF311_12075 [Candidatus Lokiarchaeota archaeon]|nr:hypothetical protein [Candidatus Lokiarchaeota archaeon]